jgi:hypothetical protein
MTEVTQDPLVERLRSSAQAFRDHTLYDSEGDALRLGVQADEMLEAAERILALESTLGWHRSRWREVSDDWDVNCGMRNFATVSIDDEPGSAALEGKHE